MKKIAPALVLLSSQSTRTHTSMSVRCQWPK